MTANFNTNMHASGRIQNIVGLFAYNCVVPRQGDRTAAGHAGFSINSSYAHMTPIPTEDARRCWALIPQATKDQPGDVDTTKALWRLALNAAESPTQGMRDALRAANEPAPEGVTFYIAPGSPLFDGPILSNKFISYLYLNMDVGHRVKWYDLTGREQYEWYENWVNSGRAYVRMEAETLGLRGTDLARIPDLPALETVMPRTPSLAGRRPPTHPVSADNWRDTANRVLDMD